MGYFTVLRECADWLQAIQNQDGGFGLVKGQQSTLVNTAEAVFILRRAGRVEVCRRAYSYILDNWKVHIREFGPRTRYVAYTLFALSDSGDSSFYSTTQECIDWLHENQNPATGAWSPEKNSTEDCLLSTFQAVWALRHAGEKNSIYIERAQQWILSLSSSTGWSLEAGAVPSSVATAYAVLMLVGNSRAKESLGRAHSFLLQQCTWPTYEESVVAGTTWRHCTHTWVIPALIALGEAPYAPTIANLIRSINSLRLDSGGWKESAEQPHQTVRGQFWSVYALSELQDAFEPDVYIPRIDAERSESTHQEPEFVKLNIRTKWAIVVPARIYRYVVYLLLALVITMLIGLQNNLQWPIWGDDVIVILALLSIYVLVTKRRKTFPRLNPTIIMVISLLSVLHLIVGVTLIDVIEALRSFISQHLK